MKSLLFSILSLMLLSCASSTTTDCPLTIGQGDTISYVGKAEFRCVGIYNITIDSFGYNKADTSYLDTIYVTRTNEDSIVFTYKENSACDFENGLLRTWTTSKMEKNGQYHWQWNNEYTDDDVKFIFYGSNELKARHFWAGKHSGMGSEYIFKGKKLSQ